MKMNKLVLASLFAFSVSGVQASEGNGKIKFTGEIINAPCSVAPESIDQVVSLGQINSTTLANGGKSSPEPFTIELRDCDLSTRNNVTVTFTGAQATPTDATLLGISGSASGAGIGILSLANSATVPVTLGTPTGSIALIGVDNTLNFSAYLQGLDAATDVTTGTFTALANFKLAYL